MKLRTARISIFVLMALMVQSGYGAPSTFAKALRLAVHGDRKAAIQTIVDSGQSHRLQVLDPDKVPMDIRKVFPIVEQKVIESSLKANPSSVPQNIPSETTEGIKIKAIAPKINKANPISVPHEKESDQKIDSFGTNSKNLTQQKVSFCSPTEIKEQIQQHEVISFDIFDTLLLRPYVKPSDLFVHLERLENASGFAKARIEAERTARRKHSEKEDVSFDEIYAEIEPNFSALKNKEMELERQVLTANPEMKEAFDYTLQQGKRVVITSDIYLPTNFLQQVLEEKGYMGFHKIYVSGDQGKVKGSGHLFDYLLQDENAKNAANVLHIGDNKHSDKDMAEKKGISAIWYQKRIDKLFSENKRAKIFYDKHRNELDASILLGMLALSNPTGNYWYDFGYTYAGPTILGFMKWLDKQAQKDGCKEILFVARDGYTPEKVFNIIKTDENIRTHYVYAPRRLKCAIINGDNKEKKKYAHYLDQFGLKDEKVMLIDSNAGGFSFQKTIASTLPEKYIKGCYFFIREGHYLQDRFGNAEAYCTNYNTFQWINIMFTELFMSAPTPPIAEIDENGNPVFEHPTEDEIKLTKMYPNISDGAVKFAQTYVDIFEKKDIYFSSEILVDWINTFIDVPTKVDKDHFVDAKHGHGSFSHSSYMLIMQHWYN